MSAIEMNLSCWLPGSLWANTTFLLSGDQFAKPSPKSPLLSCLAWASELASYGITYRCAHPVRSLMKAISFPSGEATVRGPFASEIHAGS